MKALLAGLALLLVASTATAADANGWYAGIGAGQSELRNVCSGAGAVTPLDECDEDSVAWKVLLGRNLSKIWGIEFSYVDAGEAKVTASASAGTLVVNPRILVAFGVLNIPLGNHLGIFAKAGLAYFKTTFERTGSFLALSSGATPNKAAFTAKSVPNRRPIKSPARARKVPLTPYPNSARLMIM